MVESISRKASCENHNKQTKHSPHAMPPYFMLYVVVDIIKLVLGELSTIFPSRGDKDDLI